MTLQPFARPGRAPRAPRPAAPLGALALLVGALPAAAAPAKPTAGASGYALVPIPAGRFTMGAPVGEPGRADDEAQRPTTLSTPLLVGRTEVTQALWSRVMGGNPSTPEMEAVPLLGADLPVHSVSWCDALEFANRLSALDGLPPAYSGVEGCLDSAGASVAWDRASPGYRLPTEAEWEYAARAGSPDPFAGAASVAALCKVANVADATMKKRLPDWPGVDCDDKVLGLAPVGRFAPNAWGLHDMSGNVWEWVWDRYAPYGAAEATDPAGAEGGKGRLMRGGGWFSEAETARVAARGRADESYSNADVGLRLVRKGG